MPPKRPGGEGKPDNIEFALEQIKIDTEKADIAPTAKQFLALSEQVLRIRLAGQSKASAWETYCSDLERLLSFLPRRSGQPVRELYSGIRQEKIYRKPVWGEFYSGILDFFRNQAAKNYEMPEEKEFWNACLGKYLEMFIKYKDIM